MTQRRILTLLDTPGTLRDLALGPMVNTAWLTRDATRLAQAGLVTYEAADPALIAANAASLAVRQRSQLARALPPILIAGAACVVIWAGWRFSAAPSTSSDARTRAGAATAGTTAPGAAIEAHEPPVIATRVLRGDADRTRESAKDARGAATKSFVGTDDAARASGVDATASSKPQAPVHPTQPTTASGPELEPDARSESVGSNALPER